MGAIINKESAKQDPERNGEKGTVLSTTSLPHSLNLSSVRMPEQTNKIYQYQQFLYLLYPPFFFQKFIYFFFMCGADFVSAFLIVNFTCL